MKIKKGDNVIVIAGKDKGKTGKIDRSLPKENKVIISGINLLKRHQKAKRSDQKGQIVDKAMPIHVSNVMLADKKSSESAKNKGK